MIAGKIVDNQGNAISNAAVMLKTNGNLLANERTLTDKDGNFQLEKSENSNVLVVRKAGFLPIIREISENSADTGTIALECDPLEFRIDGVMAKMPLAQKIAQMVQPLADMGFCDENNFFFGSVLNGGDGHAPDFLNDMAAALKSFPENKAKIPVWYGKDAVHGNAGIPGCTAFPHNIGLGATRDPNLVQKIGEATAKEMWATGIDLNFSPAISVALDPRWGRTYESFGENPELHVKMGAAMVRGLQGERFDAPWRITSVAKHFLGDGGTANGKDRGDTAASDCELRKTHLPGYEAVVEQGVLGVMASFNMIRGTHQHIDKTRLTGWLKTELGFDGFVISDWMGIANSTDPGNTQEYGTPGGPELTKEAIKKAINAGIDLAMEPGGGLANPSHTIFMEYLTELVNEGEVSQDRIDDAVRRILRAKFRAGRMDNPEGPAEFMGKTANINCAEHRALAREAVRKSQVLLKNENALLPLSKDAKIHVFGSHHDNIGLQCGGWTLVWLGVEGNIVDVSWWGGEFDLTKIGTSIGQGIRDVAGKSVEAENADVIIYVCGEKPYAEWHGSIDKLDFAPNSADLKTLAKLRAAGKKIITIFVAGRPRGVSKLLDTSDAFLMAWLPGTEGGGVADILFGDYPVSGKLPISWRDDTGVKFPYGFGIEI